MAFPVKQVNSMSDIVILSGQRTPMGGFQGEFSSLTAPQLGAGAIAGAIAKAGRP